MWKSPSDMIVGSSYTVAITDVRIFALAQGGRPHFLVIRAKRGEELQADQRDHARQIKQRVSDLFLKALYARVIKTEAGRGLHVPSVPRVQDFRSGTRRRRFGREPRRRDEGGVAVGGMDAPRSLREAGEPAEQTAQTPCGCSGTQVLSEMGGGSRGVR